MQKEFSRGQSFRGVPLGNYIFFSLPPHRQSSDTSDVISLDPTCLTALSFCILDMWARGSMEHLVIVIILVETIHRFSTLSYPWDYSCKSPTRNDGNSCILYLRSDR